MLNIVEGEADDARGLKKNKHKLDFPQKHNVFSSAHRHRLLVGEPRVGRGGGANLIRVRLEGDLEWADLGWKNKNTTCVLISRTEVMMMSCQLKLRIYKDLVCT